MGKGQVSMEFLMVTGFAFLLVLPLIGLFYYHSGVFQEDVLLSQTEKIGTEIVNTANEVYYLGQPSKKTIKVYVPDGVKSVSLSGDEIAFLIESKSGDYYARYDAATNLTGIMRSYEGVHELTIRARANDVFIEEK